MVHTRSDRTATPSASHASTPKQSQPAAPASSAQHPPPSATAQTPTPTSTTTAQPAPLQRASSSQRRSAATPTRQSLRQTLAASARDAAVVERSSSRSASTSTSRGRSISRNNSATDAQQQPIVVDEDDGADASSSSLSSLDSDDENDSEDESLGGNDSDATVSDASPRVRSSAAAAATPTRRRARAIVASDQSPQFLALDRRDNVDDDATEAEISSFSESEEVDWEERQREWREDMLTMGFNKGPAGDALVDDDPYNSEGPQNATTDGSALPAGGGTGVVTWSDYEYESSEGDDNETGEFDAELAELLEMSEAVVRPHVTVSDGENLSLEAMWLEDAGDDEDDDDEENDESDDDDNSEHTILVVNTTFDSDSDLSELETDSNATSLEAASDIDATESDDSGESTDSLDSDDDDDDLAPFGVQLLSSEAFGPSPRQLPQQPQQPARARTESEVVLLMPQNPFTGFRHLEESSRTTLDNIQADPARAIRTIARELGIGHHAAAQIVARLNRSSFKRNRAISTPVTTPDGSAQKSLGAALPLAPLPRSSPRRKAQQQAEEQHQQQQQQRETPSDDNAPKLGSFDATATKPMRHAKSVVIADDKASTATPNPFSRAVAGDRKRKRNLLELSSSLLRVRHQASRNSSNSRGSSSTDVPRPIDDDDFDLEDLIDLSELLNEQGAFDQSAPEDEGEDEAADSKRPRLQSESETDFSDLSRWSRVPIGAFRSQALASGSAARRRMADPESEGNTASNARRMLGKSPDARHRRSHTTPRQYTGSSRAAIDRMLSSPVLMPQSAAQPQLPPSSSAARHASRSRTRTRTARDSPAPGGSRRSQTPSATPVTTSSAARGSLLAPPSELGGDQPAPPVTSPLFSSLIGVDIHDVPSLAL